MLIEVINNINKKIMKILTTHTYWQSVGKSTQGYWRNVAAKFPQTLICTGRPDLREYKGDKFVRRASTGGRWGQSADICQMNLEKLFATTAFVLLDI